jgi:hypothetical protein
MDLSRYDEVAENTPVLPTFKADSSFALTTRCDTGLNRLGARKSPGAKEEEEYT